MTWVRVWCFVLVAVTAAGGEFSGKVVAVADGDTITVLVGKEQRKVRLYGIDCPERGQGFSAKAKEFTSDLAFGKTVTVEVRDKDQYGREVGLVRLSGGKVLNEELLRAGLAWWFRKYAPHEERFAKLESAARESKAGLWSEKKPEPPWEFRAKKRAAGATRASIFFRCLDEQLVIGLLQKPGCGQEILSAERLATLPGAGVVFPATLESEGKVVALGAVIGRDNCSPASDLKGTGLQVPERPLWLGSCAHV